MISKEAMTNSTSSPSTVLFHKLNTDTAVYSHILKTVKNPTRQCLSIYVYKVSSLFYLKNNNVLFNLLSQNRRKNCYNPL